jgi:hypothetical protein
MISDEQFLRNVFFIYNEPLLDRLSSLRALIDCATSQASQDLGDSSILCLALTMIADRLSQFVSDDIPSTSDLIIDFILSQSRNTGSENIRS